MGHMVWNFGAGCVNAFFRSAIVVGASTGDALLSPTGMMITQIVDKAVEIAGIPEASTVVLNNVAGFMETLLPYLDGD